MKDSTISSAEIKYTSTSNKLLLHDDRIEEIKKGIFRPLSLQLAPTDKCNLNCSFCSVKNRDGDEILFSKVQKLLDDFKRLGAKTVEITGGGDPTMYPQINETIQYAKGLGYEIGMISNGVIITKKISQENLDLLTWLRISLNSLDYVKDIDVPKINGTLGFSYVRNEKTDLRMLDKLVYYAEKHGADFVRVVPNCLDVEEKEKYINELGPIIAQYPKLFFQQKEHKVPEKCWIGYIKPFIAPDGNVYMCSANPLIDRKFNKNFVIGNIDNLDASYQKIKDFDTSHCEEGKCFFKEHNDLIKNIGEGKTIPSKNDIDIPHKNFI